MKRYLLGIFVLAWIVFGAGCSNDTISRRRPRPQDPEEAAAPDAPAASAAVATTAPPATAPADASSVQPAVQPAVQVPSATGPATASVPKPNSPPAPTAPQTALKPAAPAADDDEAGWAPVSPKGTTPGATPNTNVAGEGQVTPDSADEDPDAGASEEAKRQRTIRRLTKIHAALESYRKRNGAYPTPSLDLKLSWRVMILHDLGYGALYSRFRMGEPWNSPHNLKLASEIPDEFRAPHVDAPKTNFLLMRGAGTVFPSEEGLDPAAIVDQPENTLLLAEVDPQYAAIWTQPGDYQVARDRLQQEFFGLHRDGCFGIFGGETGVRFIPANISDKALSAILTPAGREEVSAVEVARLPVASIDRPLIELLAKQPISREMGNVVGKESSNSGQAGMQPLSARGGPNASGSQDLHTKWDLPQTGSVRDANASLNDIYGTPEEIAKKKKEDRRELAKKLLSESDRFRNEPAEFYAVLVRAKDLAAESGDVTTCVDALEKMNQYFNLKDNSVRMKALETTARNLGEDRGGLSPLGDAAVKLGNEMLEFDDFQTASSAFRLAVAAARRANDQQKVVEINERIDRLEAVKKAHRKIVDSASTLLRDPNSPNANAIVGRYLCLVKNNFANGIPHLLRGNDEGLRLLAERDQSDPLEAKEQLQLGDAWWEFGESAGNELEKEGARERARHWYQQAVTKLPDGLGKVRAETRLKDEEEKSGKQASRRGHAAGRAAAPKIGVSTD